MYNDETLEKIEAAARNASRNWGIKAYNGGMVRQKHGCHWMLELVGSNGRIAGCGSIRSDDLNFLLTVGPETVLSLTAEIRRLRGETKA